MSDFTTKDLFTLIALLAYVAMLLIGIVIEDRADKRAHNKESGNE